MGARLNTTPRQILEFSLYISALLLADPTKISIFVGILVSALGMGLRISASGFYRGDLDFIVRGPYRFVRHPHFFGSLLLTTGVSLGCGNWAVLILSIFILGLFYQREIAFEEVRLAKKWGPKYTDFRVRVSTIIPQLIPADPVDGKGRVFLLRRSMMRGRMREVNAILAMVVVFSLLYWKLYGVDSVNYYGGVGSSVVVITAFRFFCARKMSDRGSFVSNNSI